jgi:hypothetical protein
MKKTIFILGVIFIVAASSCNKDKVCECVQHWSGPGTENFEDYTSTETISEGECSARDTTMTSDGITVKTTCKEL